MPEIKQLPPHVVNQIAAGEVIERPASVVKELLENAVDAGATRIDVDVQKGGSELIRVVDNGQGLSSAELPLAVASHATSKIESADDLFRVGTMGFRGEALASISAVSRFLIRSRREADAAGAELEVHGGRSGEVQPAACAAGTTVEVRDLLFNTPARRKFLRTVQTEMGHISEAVARLALGHLGVHFRLRHGGREVYDVPPCESLRERVAAFYGRELAEALIWIESVDQPLRLSGYVAHPSQSRSNNRMQYIFLNRRHIRDRALQHALGEAYRGLLLSGRYPIAFLNLEMPAELVDVNVHPTKLEVRFQDSGRVYSQLLGTLRAKFLSTDLTTKLDRPEPAEELLDEPPVAAPHTAEASEKVRGEFVEWAKGQLNVARGEAESRQAELNLALQDAGEANGHRQPLELVELDPDWVAEQTGQSAAAPVDSPAAEMAPPSTARTGYGTPAMQIHNRYLITESDDGVVVIDQHALHERILYEQLREKVLSDRLETQRLLVPETIHLSPTEAAAVLESRELLAQLGIEVEAFGGDCVLVSTYPAMIANLSPAELLRQMVEHLVSGGKQPDRRDVIDELLHMNSCKAAIKAGDRLSSEEVRTLLEQRGSVADTHHCPHGRPTELVFTRKQLDRLFQRI